MKKVRTKIDTRNGCVFVHLGFFDPDGKRVWIVNGEEILDYIVYLRPGDDLDKAIDKDNAALAAMDAEPIGAEIIDEIKALRDHWHTPAIIAAHKADRALSNAFVDVMRPERKASGSEKTKARAAYEKARDAMTTAVAALITPPAPKPKPQSEDRYA